ncbi:MAG: N-acetyltransferase [Prevotella sp.]|nr:N-acetyltransferase [Prevotella sp.]
MKAVNVVKVNGRAQMNDFLSVTRHIYQDSKQYVPDLRKDVRELFDPKKNPGLEFSDIQPFVAYQEEKPVGRIVGIVNRKANRQWHTRNVRFSMIEFVDDEAVSAALLKAVEDWGRTHGMEKIHGPLGITDFDKEGMLVEDFHLMGSVNTIYNPEYYPRHMEALGFSKEVDWVQIRIQIPQDVPAKYVRVANYVREQLGLNVIKLNDHQVYEEGYGKKVFELLNTAYKPIFGFSELSARQVDRYLHKYLAVIDKQLIPVIVNDKQEVVGVAISMGSISKAVQKANGNLLPFGWYHLLRVMKWKREDNAEMLLIAVRPDLQGMGVNTLFFTDLIPIFNQYGFKWAETGPQLEYNMHELTQWKPLNPQLVKRRRCYTKQIS